MRENYLDQKRKILLLMVFKIFLIEKNERNGKKAMVFFQ